MDRQTDGWMDRWTDELTGRRTDGWIGGQMNGQADGRMDGWVDKWMDDCPCRLALPGESVPAEEQFDKDKAKAELQSLDAPLSNHKPSATPALSSLPGLQPNGAERAKYESELAKLYKELDDKVSDNPNPACS